jgi:hypothetical protein
MSIFLSLLAGWLAFNVVIVAVMHLKPLRSRRRGRPPEFDSLAIARYRRRPF